MRGQLLSRINVLVVEDYADSRETHHGAAVIPVESATRAMEIVTRFTPSIVIADIAMPQHGGLWLLRDRHHQNVAGRYVRVVTLTASVGRPLRADLDAILIKPCPVDKLCQVILRLTTSNERRIGQE